MVPSLCIDDLAPYIGCHVASEPLRTCHVSGLFFGLISGLRDLFAILKVSRTDLQFEKMDWTANLDKNGPKCKFKNIFKGLKKKKEKRTKMQTKIL
jgi:hypothetical protein